MIPHVDDAIGVIEEQARAYLSTREEATLEQLLVETVCDPPGLPDIRYTLSEEQLRRLVYAYDSSGQPLPNWHHDVMLPQVGLRGTLDDLLTFTEANLGVRRGFPDGEAGLHPFQIEWFRLVCESVRSTGVRESPGARRTAVYAGLSGQCETKGTRTR